MLKKSLKYLTKRLCCCIFDENLIKNIDEKLNILFYSVKRKRQKNMYFSSNIKFLRKRRGQTQDDIAFAMGIKRSTLSGYENDVAQPNIDTLISFSNYFKVAIDTLVKVDLSKIGDEMLSQLERGYDVFLKGSNIRILATTVDAGNNENIELVNEKAKAGYATGYSDPDYIKELPAFHLPFLSMNRKYRTFQISGDSMLPIPDKSYVTGEYVLDITDIRSWQAYIIITVDDGVLFKVVENKFYKGFFRLYSLNTSYKPYILPLENIREVWRFVHYISDELPESLDNDRDVIFRTMGEIKETIKTISKKLDDRDKC